MKLGKLWKSGGLVFGALSGLWIASACSGGGSSGGSFVEKACGSICARSKQAADSLGCSSSMESRCYVDCVQQSLNCSPDRLGELSNCIGPLSDSDFICSGSEAVPASRCSAERTAYESSCMASGGTTGSGGSSSGGSSSGGSAGKGGASGSSSGGTGGTLGGSAGSASGGTGGSVTAICTGDPYPCSYFVGASCAAQFGCTATTGCSGIARDCYEFDIYGDLSCAAQLGCTWDYELGACLGVPYYCDEILDSTTCYSQLDCSWADTCLGTPYTCSSFPADGGCTLQQGCYVQYP